MTCSSAAWLSARRSLGTSTWPGRRRTRPLSTPTSSASSPRSRGAASGRARVSISRTRHLITLAMLAALGKHDELAMHMAATRRTGVTVGRVEGSVSAGGHLRRHAVGQRGVRARETRARGAGSVPGSVPGSGPGSGPGETNECIQARLEHSPALSVRAVRVDGAAFAAQSAGAAGAVVVGAHRSGVRFGCRASRGRRSDARSRAGQGRRSASAFT